MNLEDLLVFAVRTLLALFVSALLAAICYMFGWLVAYSVVELTPTTVTMASVISVSIGAAIGGYAAWPAQVGAFYWHAAYLAMVFFCAGGGASVGLWQGRGQFQTGGVPGIPELSGMLTGGILAACISALALYYLPRLFAARRRPSAQAR